MADPRLLSKEAIAEVRRAVSQGGPGMAVLLVLLEHIDALEEQLAVHAQTVTAAEAGRRGGARTKELHPDLFREIGSLGGKKVAERGTEYFQEIGKQGGQLLAATRGKEYFRAIGTKGGAKTAAKGSTHYQDLARKRWKKP